MVRDMLPKGNFQVLEAKDGVEGMNCIRQERPNLIMLDFLLPRMSGWEVFQQIQTQPDLQSIPPVLMSGRREEVTEKIPEPFEYFEFVEKPFEQKDLIEAIKAAMAKSRLPRARTTMPTTAPAADAGDLTALTQKVEKMQAEIDMLKKQLNQVMTFVKQKLK